MWMAFFNSKFEQCKLPRKGDQGHCTGRANFPIWEVSHVRNEVAINVWRTWIMKFREPKAFEDSCEPRGECSSDCILARLSSSPLQNLLTQTLYLVVQSTNLELPRIETVAPGCLLIDFA